MFDWLREIRDNIKAEVYLSLPAKKERSSLWRGIINEDGALCAEFEDSYNRIIIGRILSDIENKNLSIYLGAIKFKNIMPVILKPTSSASFLFLAVATRPTA